MAPELQRNDPPYVQIAQQIRAEIESGKLRAGDSIPSAREITATWGVALATATKVHARLRSEGLVRAVPGVGTIVAGGQATFGGAQRLASVEREGRVYGVDERAVILSSEIVEAPEHVADALGAEAHSMAIRRQRLTKRSDEPSSLSVSWFSTSVAESAPDLLRGERIPQGTFSYVARNTGRRVTEGREQTQAGYATDVEASALGIAPGSPVLRSRTWFFADDSSVVEFGESAHGADRWLTHEFAINA